MSILKITGILFIMCVVMVMGCVTQQPKIGNPHFSILSVNVDNVVLGGDVVVNVDVINDEPKKEVKRPDGSIDWIGEAGTHEVTVEIYDENRETLISNQSKMIPLIHNETKSIPFTFSNISIGKYIVVARAVSYNTSELSYTFEVIDVTEKYDIEFNVYNYDKVNVTVTNKASIPLNFTISEKTLKFYHDNMTEFWNAPFSLESELAPGESRQFTVNLQNGEEDTVLNKITWVPEINGVKQPLETYDVNLPVSIDIYKIPGFVYNKTGHCYDPLPTPSPVIPSNPPIVNGSG